MVNANAFENAFAPMTMWQTENVSPKIPLADRVVHVHDFKTMDLKASVNDERPYHKSPKPCYTNRE